ncbi:chymotrypsin A-like [Ornithodoros turicata]|uniref:chymotrypsin A-like n=1 Tax=Ornithodoros turicata TaxID=34597 RepID=UPI0031398E4C
MDHLVPPADLAIAANMIRAVLFVLVALGYTSATTVVCRTTTLHVTLHREVVVVTPGYDRAENYPNSYVCAITLTAPLTTQKVRVDFEDFDLESSALCRADRLDIQEVQGKNLNLVGSYCSTVRPKSYVSLTNSLNLSFVSDELRSGRGFRIRVTPTNSRIVCGSGEFQCSDRECVSASKRCDGIYDCQDASDEKRCPRRPNLQRSQCGRPVVQPDAVSNDRIVGGHEAVPHSWPWQVGVQRKLSEPLNHFCGGTIISNQWIVCAAHCFLGVIGADEVIIKAGLHDMLNPSEQLQIRTPNVIIKHENFLGGLDLNYDIALVQVSVPFNFTDTVRPSCLPEDEEPLPVNATCYSSGWGQTRGSGSAFRLKQTRLKVEDVNYCRSGPRARIAKLGYHGNNSICTTSLDMISGLCHGDSGGPLECKAEDGRWVVYGVASLTADNTIVGTVCGMGGATLWNSVARHRLWILQQITSYRTGLATDL